MLTALRQRNFTLLWLSGLISLSGDWILLVGLPIYVYQLTNSTLATGTVFLVGRLPGLILGTPAGVFVDRWDRRRTVICTNVLLAVSLLPLLAVQGSPTLWLVYVVSFCIACIRPFATPAEQALLPTLVASEQRIAANALNALNYDLAQIAGPALGGAVALLGLRGIILFDGGSFLIAALLVLLIRAETAAPSAPTVVRSTGLLWAGVWRDWLAGLRLVRQTPVLTIVFGLVAIIGIGDGIKWTLLAPFVSRVLGGGTPEFGSVLAAEAVGGLAGSLLIGRLGTRVAMGPLLGICGISFGLTTLLLYNYPAVYPAIWPALLLSALRGAPGAIFGVTLITVLQNHVTDAYRGRIFAALGTTAAVALLLGGTVASVIGSNGNVAALLSIQGIGALLAAGLALVLLRPESH